MLPSRGSSEENLIVTHYYFFQNFFSYAALSVTQRVMAIACLETR